MRIRYSFFFVGLLACTGTSAFAGPFDGATYDTPAFAGSTLSIPAVPAGTPINTNNAYLAVVSLAPAANCPSCTPQLNLLTGTINLNQFASNAALQQAQSQSQQSIAALNASLQQVQSQSQQSVAALNSSLQQVQSQSQQSVAALNSSLQQVQSQLQQSVVEANKHAWVGSALSASLVNTAPLNGLSNRVGMNMATVGGQNAIGVNYSRVQGDLDLNAGVAVTPTSKYALGRVGMGFSW